MANFQPYPLDPRGDGVRYPIRQASIRFPNGNLPTYLAQKLYKARGAAPLVFNHTIKSAVGNLPIQASAFASYGSGRKKKTGGRKKKTGGAISGSGIYAAHRVMKRNALSSGLY